MHSEVGHLKFDIEQFEVKYEELEGKNDNLETRFEEAIKEKRID